jgi:hypothetical protein
MNHRSAHPAGKGQLDAAFSPAVFFANAEIAATSQVPKSN